MQSSLTQTKRFELDYGFGIKDNLTGRRYSERSDLVELLNDVNDKADRNAELLDIDCVAQKEFVEKVLKIMRKYEIDSLEKLDLVLFHQRVW